MAREINWNEPLGDEDRLWAMQHDRLHDKIRENDERFGGKRDQTRDERIAELQDEIGVRQTELSMLETERDREAALVPNVAVAGDPSIGQGVLDNTTVNGETPDGAPDPVDDYSDQTKWTKPTLSGEIDKRNKARLEDGVEPLSKSGTRSELVERLRADDRELAEG